MLVLKALIVQAPAYIYDLLTPYKPEQCLRSFWQGSTNGSKILNVAEAVELPACGS